MSSIAKYFESKKRDLSNKSSNEEEAKKLKEASNNQSSSEASNVSSCNDDVFEGSLQSKECVDILKNCMQSIEIKVNQLFTVVAQTNESQIKGESQLNDLKESIKYVSNKLDEIEKKRQEQDEKIHELKKELQIAQEERKSLFKLMDRQQQYSRRNCLLVHGIVENKIENTDEVVTKVFLDELGESVNEKDIDRSHRLGPFNPSSTRPCPIIVKFARYNCRRNIFVKKKALKGKGIAITESLTDLRLKKLTEARELHGFSNVWSIDGKIIYKDTSDNDKKKVFYD